MVATRTVEVNSTALLSVDVQVACTDESVPDVDEIRRWIDLAATESGRLPAGNAEVSVRIVDAEEIAELNRRYRQRDQPTNVLSFPADNVEGMPDDVEKPLGDVLVCAPVVAREAGEQGKLPADHWAHMLVHGMLHLLGFDHLAETEAQEMEGLERRILAIGGVADPYSSQ